MKLLLFILLFACSPDSQHSVVGFYKSKEYNFIQRAIKALKNEPYTLGATLTINKDSSFTETTCGNTISGRWRVSENFLLLKAATNRFNNDSLNKFGLNSKQPSIGTV